MADNTIIQQGKFTSDGTTKLINIRADADWMYVYNYTNAGATGNDSVKFYWQRGMDNLTGVRYFKSGGGNALNMSVMTTTGFTKIDTSANPLSAAVAISGATNVVNPVVSTASTAGLSDGDLVLLTGTTGQENLSGLVFQIESVVTNTSFVIASALATAPGAAASAGFWRKVKWDPIYYPRRAYISNITQASSAVITTTADHGFTVGQKVRLVVPSVYGMTQINNLTGTVTAVTTWVQTTGEPGLTVDIDSTSFTAFQFPLPAIVPFTPAQVVPIGEDTASAISNSTNILADAADNTAVIAMSLPAGADAPGGAANDVMYWVSGKSFDVTNE